MLTTIFMLEMILDWRMKKSLADRKLINLEGSQSNLSNSLKSDIILVWLRLWR